MRFSKFVHIYELAYDNCFYYVIRHSITNNSFLLNEKEYNKLIRDLNKGIKDKTLKKLEKTHILVSNDYKEEKFIEFLKRKFHSDEFDLEIIYLIFNTDCNLKCKYCYIEGSKRFSFKHNSMSNKTFLHSMKFLNKLIKEIKKKKPSKNKLTFIFYGSEPLMSKRLVEESLENITNICKQCKIIPDFQLITNGILLTEKTITKLKKFNVKVSISLDGSKEINDLMRITKSNKGTYDSVIKSINLLNKNKLAFGISCTISQHNIKNLRKNIELFKELGATSIGFNLLLNARFIKIPLISLNKLNDNLICASDFANSLGIYEDRVQRKVGAFNSNFPRLKDCGGVGNQIVLFPNGDVGICEAYLCNRKYILGKVKDLSIKEIENSEIVKKWTKRYPLNMKECLFCPAIGICGGGCPFNAETRTGDIYNLDKPFCVHTNKVLNWLSEIISFALSELRKHLI